MRRWFLIALLLFASAIILMIVSVASGEGQVGLFLIFPFIVAWGPMAVVGSVLLFLAIVSFLIGFLRSGEVVLKNAGGADPVAKTGRKFGGVVMIGPIPIVFGSDRKIANWMLLAGVVLFTLMAIIYLIFLRQL